MSSVADVKKAIENFDPRQRQEFVHWFTHRPDFQHQAMEELRRDIADGIAQADRGDLGPLDMDSVRRRVKEATRK